MAAERTWNREGMFPGAPGTIVPDDGGAPGETTMDVQPVAMAALEASPLAAARDRRGRAPGVRIGPFELLRRLGEGASGEVWEAVDRRIDAPVALKLFNARGMDPMGRVMAEARAASRVVSDHVVYVREAGRVDGEAFIAMALCREETASDAAPKVARNLNEDAPRSLTEAVRWGEQIARGVAAAHAVGVYHRDLKPENVLCLPRSRAVRIVDFGLAPLTAAGRIPLDSDPAAGSLMVGPGEVARYIAGSPAYMAPEQARGFRRAPQAGRDDKALAALDVYGIGATVWSLLAGRAPHADPAVDDSPEVVRVRAATEAPPDLRSLAPNVPRRLAAIIGKAMADDPDERYPSAAALAVELARFRAQLPTSLDAPWSLVVGALYLRRHPALVAAAAWVLVVALGLGAIGVVHARWNVATSALAVVETQREAAEHDAAVEAALARAEGRRADAAADAADFSAARAETAEERSAHLRRYAARQALQAQDADLLRAGAEAESLIQGQIAADAREEAAREAEVAANASDRAADAIRRAADADARARRHAEAEAAAVARAETADRAAGDALATAETSRARAEDAEERAASAERRMRAAEARAEAMEGRLVAGEPLADEAG
ncbi:MAG: serine/threonine-protein kinase [Pseudomonadota bacterium]|nr:serine/threonine-protein kinase [Pseudomonadota bacterium]